MGIERAAKERIYWAATAAGKGSTGSWWAVGGSGGAAGGLGWLQWGGEVQGADLDFRNSGFPDLARLPEVAGPGELWEDLLWPAEGQEQAGQSGQPLQGQKQPHLLEGWKEVGVS
jgi:hypothetical protein